jgi:octaprenyl-diphosphate synthase
MTARPTRTAATTGRPAPGNLFVRLQPHLRALDRLLRSQVDGFEPEIRDLVEYCLDISGKRIRPSLVFFSGWKGPGKVSPALVRAAAIVEMVHLATLVHDDIMDGAELRRNRPTAARRFGSDAAVLLGDALLAHAVDLAAAYPSTEVCRVVARATRLVCTGEITQTLRRGDTSITRAVYRRIIEFKTAELFRLSCFLGSRLAGYDDGYVEAAAEFGRRLGIAYQIYDDLADFFGEEKRIGKTLGTDLAGGKITLPLLLLLKKLPVRERAELLHEIRDQRTPHYERRRAQMNGHGVFAAVAADIRAELKAAQEALASWADLEPAVLLGELVEMLRRQVEDLRPRVVS